LSGLRHSIDPRTGRSRGKDITPFYLGYAYEALARAAAVAGDRERVSAYLVEARQVADSLSNPEARQPLLDDLATVHWTGSDPAGGSNGSANRQPREGRLATRRACDGFEAARPGRLRLTGPTSSRRRATRRLQWSGVRV
jgi:uncharacterized protein (DUF1778 family)